MTNYFLYFGEFTDSVSSTLIDQQLAVANRERNRLYVPLRSIYNTII